MVRAGVRFRVYDDGVVVYVADTCATHLLPVGVASLLLGEGRPASASAVDEDEALALWDELASLRIVDARH